MGRHPPSTSVQAKPSRQGCLVTPPSGQRKQRHDHASWWGVAAFYLMEAFGIESASLVEDT